jgi:DNA helicase-2/ATP-dependent DNA helicase PcrA
MRFLADLHIHSKFSRATGQDTDLEHLWVTAQKKGLTVVGTGDFTHPAWLAELEGKLEPAEPGLLRLKPELERALAPLVPAACRGTVRFALSVEISNIYSAGGQVRKVHNLCLVPDLERARRFRQRLQRIGNLDSDGRPILGLDSRDLLEILCEVGGGSFLVPAHIWTPWFSVLGSKSGFDSIEECYRDLSHEIFAVETGLSSDPEMNWTCSILDPYVMLSNSDAHSPDKLGREANRFDCELSYFAMRDALKHGGRAGSEAFGPAPGGFLGTLEFFPEEGKYHLDGHRKCGVVFEPAETTRRNGVCPVCGKVLTVGVMNRVYELSDREVGEKAPRALPFSRLVPLPEVVGQRLQVGVASRRVGELVARLQERLGPELLVLEQVPLEEVRRADPVLAEGLARMRAGQVRVKAGYDGEYGVVEVFEGGELASLAGQTSLLGEVQRAPRGRRATEKPQARKPGAAELPLFSSAASGGAQPLALLPGGGAAQGQGAPRPGVDEDQRRAVEHTGGALLLHAGPGSGKTRTLVERVAFLVEQRGVKPSQVLAITFTRRAAEELCTRLRQRMVRRGRPAHFEATTFHSLCLKLIEEEQGRAPRVLDDDEVAEVLARVTGRREGAPGPEAEPQARARREGLRRSISLLKQYLVPPGQGLPERGVEGSAEEWRAFAAYQAALQAAGACDLDDLLVNAVHLLSHGRRARDKWARRFPHVLVDEFQDVNAAQYELVRLLAPAGSEVVAIGDPDQAIYRFRGSDPAFFERFRRERPECTVVRLHRNYRSSREIVDAAWRMVRAGGGDQARALEAASGALSIPVVAATLASERAEAEYVAHTVEQLLGGVAHFSLDTQRAAGEVVPEVQRFSDFAVLYRSHDQGLLVAEALSRLGVPLRRSGEARAWRASDPIQHFGAFVRVLTGAGRARDFRLLVPPLDLPGGSVEDVRGLTREGFLGLVAQRWPEAHERLLALPAEEVRAVPAGELLDAFKRLSHHAPIDDDPLALLAEVLVEQGWTASQVDAGLRTLDDGDLASPRGDRVQLMTLHAAKGLEFPVVFVVGCDEGWLPLTRAGCPPESADLDEERRLLFVGMTRARRALYLLSARRRTRFGQTVACERSRFLAPLDGFLEQREPYARRRKDGSQMTLL